MSGDFFTGPTAPVLRILTRMKEFWSFESAYLARYCHATNSISMIAMSSGSVGAEAFGIPGISIGPATPVPPQTHPMQMLYDPGQKYGDLEPLLLDLQKIFQETSNITRFGVPQRGCYLFVLVPLRDEEVYAFIFAVRGKGADYGLPYSATGSVSDLCQEIILRVCTEIAHEFGYVKS